MDAVNVEGNTTPHKHDGSVRGTTGIPIFFTVYFIQIAVHVMIKFLNYVAKCLQIQKIVSWKSIAFECVHHHDDHQHHRRRRHHH